MRKVKTDNSDLVEYLKTIEALKQYPDIHEYYHEYKRLHMEGAQVNEIKNINQRILSCAAWTEKKHHCLNSLSMNLTLLTKLPHLLLKT